MTEVAKQEWSRTRCNGFGHCTATINLVLEIRTRQSVSHRTLGRLSTQHVADAQESNDLVREHDNTHCAWRSP